MTPRVLIGPSSFATDDPAPLERLRAAGVEVVPNPFGRRLSADELLQLLPGVTGLIAGLEPLTRAVLERSELRVISRCGAGMSTVDVVAARELGIAVHSTPDAPTTAVAELTVAAMLTLLRHLVSMSVELHAGRWTRALGGHLEGRTVAVIGFGRIGRRVAQLLHAFGAHVVAVDPAVHAVEPPAILAPLADALRAADIVTLHPSGEGTILGAGEFAAMKKGSLVLNAGRGGLVDEEALCAALDAGQVAGAWLDTFREEPYSGPLSRYPQVLLTPHAGSFTAECRRRMEMEAVENLIAALPRS